MTICDAVMLVRRAIGDPAGKCYFASEAVWHLVGAMRSDWRPCVMHTCTGATHWYLINTRTRAICDVTKDQFASALDYSLGKRCGFLTSQPSKRAQVVLDLVTRS